MAQLLVPLSQLAQGEVQKLHAPSTREYPAAQLEQISLLEQMRQFFTVQVTQVVTPSIVVRTVSLRQEVQMLLG